MKKILLATLMALTAAAPVLSRNGGNLGLGAQVGEPSGLSAKYWLGSTNALDFLAGFSAYGKWVFIKGDYLWHNFNLIPVSSGQLPLYYGMGGMAILSNRPGIGIEGVVGLEYLLPSAPLDVYLDLAPGVFIVPETHGYVNVGLGMRFFF
jgi:hypothetical protein